MRFSSTILLCCGSLLPLLNASPLAQQGSDSAADQTNNASPGRMIEWSTTGPPRDQPENNTPGQPDQTIVADEYIVTLKEGVDTTAHLAFVAGLNTRQKRQNQGGVITGVKKTYNIANTFNAYYGTFDDTMIDAIRNNTDVNHVERDQNYTTNALVTQPNTRWGLGRISSRARGAKDYYYDESAGRGTYAYVVDTGVNINHTEFQGRATRGYNAVGGQFTDTNGHGTHIAGVIGSATYGVAKLTNIIDVKVFNEGRTMLSTILDGYVWAANDIINETRQFKAVINLSLGGGSSFAFQGAIRVAYRYGVTTVAAAGNNNQNVATYSPANSPEAITVAASTEADDKALFSNFGTLVNFFAPGTNVLSTWSVSNSATNVISGTSVAAGHVAGVALYLQAQQTDYNPTELLAKLTQLATTNAIGAPNGSPNLLVYNGSGQ